MFGFNDQMVLVLYVPKPNKYGVTLSSMYHGASVAEQVHKPEIILHYKATESGVNNLDHYVHHQEKGEPLACCTVRELYICWRCGCIHHMASQLSWVKSSEGQRRRLFLLELAHGLIMPQVRRRSLIPILQALIRLTMKMVLQLLVSHRRLNRQLGWKVGHTVNLYVPITAPNKLCGNNSYKSRAHIH